MVLFEASYLHQATFCYGNLYQSRYAPLSLPIYFFFGSTLITPIVESSKIEADDDNELELR